MKDFNCTKCGQLSDKWERFPNDTCKACHYAQFDNVPIVKIAKPNFVKTIKV